MRTRHDRLFRRVFGKPENVGGLLRHLLPLPLSAALEWSALQREPDSYIHEETLGVRLADMLFSVPWRDAPKERFFVLVEHRSSRNESARVPFQLNDYQIHIGQSLARRRKRRSGKPRAECAPAIVSVVVYHGKHAWKASRGYIENLDVPADKRALLAGLVPDFEYLLDDLNVVSSEALRARAMPAYARLTLWFLKMAHASEALLEELGDWADVHEELRRDGCGRGARRSLWRYYLQTGQIPVEKVRKAVAAAWGRKAEEEVMTTAQMLKREGWLEGKAAGRAEGEAVGRAEGKAVGRAEGVVAVLGARGIAVSEEVRKRILSCRDVAILDRWLKRAISVTTADEVVA